MPKIKIKTCKTMGNHGVKFTIKNQGFTLETFDDYTKEDAEWTADMLQKAFEKLGVEVERE